MLLEVHRLYYDRYIPKGRTLLLSNKLLEKTITAVFLIYSSHHTTPREMWLRLCPISRHILRNKLLVLSEREYLSEDHSKNLLFSLNPQLVDCRLNKTQLLLLMRTISSHHLHKNQLCNINIFGDGKTTSTSVSDSILSKRAPHTSSMTMVKIKFLLPLLNRLESIVLQSKENVAGEKTGKRSLFLISQFRLLQLLTPAFFSLVMLSCNSIIDYEDINIFGGFK